MLGGRRTAEHRWMADVRPTRAPGAVDRRAAAPAEEDRPGSQEPAPGPAAGTDRVGRRRRARQRRDRPPVSGHATPYASGGAGSPPTASTGCATGNAAAARPGSPRCSRPRSRRWPASCPRPAGCRCRGGAPPSWPTRRSPPAWSMTSAAPRCAAGWPPTRSNRGGTGPGSPPGHRTSPPAPPSCWTCTPESTTASRSATATT